jgi:cytochrome c oxidase assembly protein subunit 15
VVRVKGQGLAGSLLGTALFGALVVGITGAITALGDTLFPARSLAEIGAPVGETAHFLQYLRVFHPYTAVAVGVAAVAIAWCVAAMRPSDAVKNLASCVTLLVVAQISVGVVNLFLRAPLPLQLAHLLLADGLWIALVLLAAAACSASAPRAVLLRGRSAEVNTAEGFH